MAAGRCIAMVLAGGRGKRLGALSHFYSKAAMHFGSNRRIIDYTLNNCVYSGIETVGVISQSFASELHSHIYCAYGANFKNTRFHMLPPNDNDNPYKGTADAIYRNIDFIESFDPECILVIPANQICRMDYNTMLTFHRDSGANATIAATAIYEEGALKSPMVNVGKYGRVFDFNEKPQQPRNLLTSMGVYVFQWDILKEYLTADSINTVSEHDFEKNILPVMLYMDEPIFAYRFEDYWRGIGTIESLWEANMEHLANPYAANWQDSRAPVLSCAQPETCKVKGEIKNSTLGDYVTVGKNSEVVSSVIMPNACIGENVKIHNTIVGVRAEIMDGIEIGCDDGIDFFVDRNVCSNGVSLVAPWVRVPGGMRFQKGSHIHKRRLDEMGPVKDKQSADAGFSNKIFK